MAYLVKLSHFLSVKMKMMFQCLISVSMVIVLVSSVPLNESWWNDTRYSLEDTEVIQRLYLPDQIRASMEFRLPTLAISDLVNALNHGGNEIAGGITSDPYGMGRK